MNRNQVTQEKMQNVHIGKKIMKQGCKKKLSENESLIVNYTGRFGATFCSDPVMRMRVCFGDSFQQSVSRW